MTRGIRGGTARQLQAVFESGAVGTLGDAELIGRFLRREPSSEPAFEALVDRHARMVFRVCRDVLGNSHEAQDAAQATFFILARKAGSIRNPDALESWLHGTARRVSGRALRESIRRRRHERRSAEISSNKPAENPAGWAELHEELAKLPVRYRDPIILCDLTGLTHEQAAGKLGCPARTLETRLYRGRERLKGRLIRRGFAPSAALVGLAWGAETQAALSAAWIASTVSLALAKNGGWTAGIGSLVANDWARRHLRESIMFKLKWILGSGLLLGLVWQQVLSQTRPTEPAREGPTAKTKISRKVADEPLPNSYTHPITVTGRALDPDGKPIAGARVYLGARWADSKRLSEVKTDENGRYEFRDVALPIKRDDIVNGRDHGNFQVYAEAEGFGFTFRQEKTYYPVPLDKKVEEDVNLIDPPASFEEKDPIVLDLDFPPAASLSGTIIDDHGNPLPNIGVRVRDCEFGVSLDDNRLWHFDSYTDRNAPPPDSMKSRTTDAAGRFEIKGLPVDCRFRIMVDAKGFPSNSILAATAEKSERYLYGEAPQTGELRLTMPIPMDIPIKMVYADTGKPAAKAFVQAGGAFDTTDDDGRVTLRLSKGEYRMSNWPAVGTPYLVTEERLEIGDKPPAEPLVYTLRLAANLEVIVTDEATGKPLSGVDLWHPTEYGPRSLFVHKCWEVATRIARRDTVRTDDQGKLKILTEPGKQKVGIGLQAYPKGYEVVEADGQDVECRAGETTTVRFKMRKSP
jgi:RNA polymerase sigma factor (sigma-70 family)